MEYPVKGWTQVMNADEVVATAQHPDIRLLQVRKNISYAPLDDAEVNMGGWVEASPATMDFSAIAYLYALHLHNELGVPVGVIDSTWGGTPKHGQVTATFLECRDSKGNLPPLKTAVSRATGFRPTMTSG